MHDESGAAAGTMTASAKDERIAQACRALAHPVRVRMLRLIGQKEAYCGDLVQAFGLAQSTVSHHLKILREAGLIVGEEQGPATCYRIDPDQCRLVGQLIGEVLRCP